MDEPDYTDNLKGKLKFWSLHCAINAVPSYLIVLVWLNQARNPIAHLAMFAAVMTFVIGYSVLTSLPGPLVRKDSLLSRALRVGLIIRTILSIITFLALPTGIFLFYTPDFWCGLAASNVVKFLYEFLGNEAVLAKAMDGSSANNAMTVGFMEVYLITILEGLILSFMLFIFSLIAVVILQMRDRKKYFSDNMHQHGSHLD